MKPNIKLIERNLIVLLLLTLPLSRRHGFVGFPSVTDLGSPYLYLSDLILLVMVCWSALSRGKAYRILLFGSLTAIFLLILLIPRGTITWYTSYWLIKALEFGVLFIFVGFGSRDTLAKSAILGFSLSGAIQALIGIGQFLMQHSLGLTWLGEQTLSPFLPGIAKIDLLPDKYIRAYGTFSHPNPLSAFLLVACVTSLIGYLTSLTRKQRLFYMVTLAITLLGEIIAFSRAGIAVSYATLGAVLLILWVKQRKGGIKYLKSAALLILVVTLAAAIPLFPYLKARTVSNAPTAFNRTYYNRLGIQIIKEHPLGTGPGTMLSDMRDKIKPDQSWEVQPPHNYFLEVAIETGILGLALLIALFAWIYKRGLEHLKNSAATNYIYSLAMLVTFMAFLLLMFFDHYFYTIQQTQLLLWFTAGLVWQKERGASL